MMLKQNGTLWGFGKGTLGEMGNGLSQNSPTIIQVPGLTNIIDVESGWYRPYAVTDTGSILVWGRNHYGQYGNGNTTASASPVLMTLPCNLSEGCAVKPDFSLSAQAVCVGDSVSVTNNSSGASTFSWQKNGQFYSNAVAPTFGMDSVGTTTITLIAEDSSCTKQTSMTVTVNALPVANVGADTSICLGDTISLSVSPAASSYNWSNGDTSQSTFVSVAGTYWCQITDANGCIDSDSMTLGTAQMPQATFMTASNQLSVTFTGLGPGPTFAWDFGDGNTGTGPSFTYTYQSSGTYYVCCTETNSIGCTTTSCDSVTVLITSIANQQLEDFKLYPNPTNGHVKLELKSQIQPSHLTFQDMRGRQLRVVADFQLRGGVFEAELNLGSFADGVYFYSMLVGEEIVSGKITVRK